MISEFGVREETNLRKLADRKWREGQEKEVMTDEKMVASHSVKSDFKSPRIQNSKSVFQIQGASTRIAIRPVFSKVSENASLSLANQK